MVDNAEFWNKSAKKYSESPIRDEETYNQKLKETRKYLKPDFRVYEFGCGTGSTAIKHAPYVKSIVATDISSEMLAIATRKAADEGVENIEFRCETLEQSKEADGSFDVVMAHNILHLLEQPSEAVEIAYRLLKPGGVFVTSTATIGELFPLWRVLLYLAQLIGKAPFVAVMKREALLGAFHDAGFAVELEWHRSKLSCFAILKKPA